MDKILVVDDEQDIRDSLRSILSKEGFTVLLASDGREALEIAKTQEPALILLDYSMPGMTGVDVAKQLKKDEATKGISIVMVTAYPGEKENGLSAGAEDFITKPVEKLDLLLRIKSVLKVRYISNELQRMIAYIAELEKE
jgi:CheY-like chemotaxis protein